MLVQFRPSPCEKISIDDADIVMLSVALNSYAIAAFALVELSFNIQVVLKIIHTVKHSIQS